jgi:UPF0755 protein
VSDSEQKISQKGRFIRRVIILIILLILFSAATTAGWVALYMNRVGPQSFETSARVFIPKGSSVVTIREILSANNIITNDIRFLLIARLKGYSSRLQAGEFLLPTGRKPTEILQILVSARSIQYPVTIPEGLRASEIAQLFADGGWCSAERFMELVHDAEFIDHLGLGELGSLEGYLFPDTYLFTKKYGGAEKIITLMVKRFTQVWNQLVSDLSPPPDQLKTITLASMVEKETAAESERAEIAGVFHNRLTRGMRLQSDPTVVYGIADFNGKITRTHLKTPHSYNTYTIPALPVGPISNPGREAIFAVLNPLETKAIFFVSKNDGTHQFSETLAEHNRAVRKYQRKKSSKKGK